MSESLNITNEDCMDLMARYPDNHFDLAIVDPPYGIDVANMNMGAGKAKRCSKIQNRNWKPKNWDNGIPTEDYFSELFRVSKNQIIWGGNYFQLPPSQYFSIWDKGEGLYGRSFAECEYAWVSNGGTRIIKVNPVQKDRIHPTQKPIQLYKWLLINYAKEGDKIVDTHIGSASIAIALDSVNKVEKMNLTLTACEIDKEYYDKAMKRIAEQTAWQSLL